MAHLLMPIAFMHCPQLHYELLIDGHLPLGRSPCAGNAPSPSPPFLGARFSVFISVFITLGIAATCAIQRGGQPHVQPHRSTTPGQEHTQSTTLHMSVRARQLADVPCNEHVRTRAARRLASARSPRAHGWFSQFTRTHTRARSVLVCYARNVRS